MQTPRAWSLLLMLVALGCAKTRFSYDVAPAFQTGASRTIAADPRSDRVIIREGLRPLNPELHLKAVLAELKVRHYRPAPSGEADLWVAVYVLVGGPSEGRGSSGKAPRREGAGEGHRGGGKGGTGRGGAPPAGRDGSTSGVLTVIVQLEDRLTGLPVWQGEARLDHEAKAADGGPLGIEEAVHQLLQPLPARPE